MATQPIGPRPAGSPGYLYAASSACNRTYLLAGVRAGLIALVLLTMLVVVILL